MSWLLTVPGGASTIVAAAVAPERPPGQDLAPGTRFPRAKASGGGGGGRDCWRVGGYGGDVAGARAAAATAEAFQGEP